MKESQRIPRGLFKRRGSKRIQKKILKQYVLGNINNCSFTTNFQTGKSFSFFKRKANDILVRHYYHYQKISKLKDPAKIQQYYNYFGIRVGIL